jgi:hypothetical protein
MIQNSYTFTIIGSITIEIMSAKVSWSNVTNINVSGTNLTFLLVFNFTKVCTANVSWSNASSDSDITSKHTFSQKYDLKTLHSYNSYNYTEHHHSNNVSYSQLVKCQ